MADGEPNQALLTTLTTEHFTLQGARSTTTSESAARSALYLGSVSSGLVALGFVAQVSAAGDVFRVFALVVLPTLFVLGLFTFVRLVELSIEDILYGRAINRIRNYYLQLAGADSRYFMLGGNDDPLGVIRNMGIHPNRWQLYFTAATAVATVNSVVGGVAVGLATGIAIDPPLGVSVAAGAVVAIASFLLHMHMSRLRHEAGVEIAPIFPTPAD
jgi:hypothetical protein